MIEITAPKTIKVGGFDIKILRGDVTTEDLRSREFNGLYDFRQKLIKIQGGLSDQQFTNTFLHEILHAIDHIYANGSLEETMVTVLANGLHQVLGELDVKIVNKPGPTGVPLALA